jgi:hypothetical protein
MLCSLPKCISFSEKYWLVIHFSVKIQNIFELIVDIYIIMRLTPQGVIKYTKHLNFKRTVCLGYYGFLDTLYTNI